MNRKRSELLVGLFLLVGLCLLGVMILKFGNLGEMFRDRYVLRILFPTAGGLTKGSEVKLSGVAIGRVDSEPTPSDNGVVVELSVFEEFPIPEASRFSIGTEGLLGDSYVAITPPKIPTGRYLKDGASIEGAGAGGLSALADSAGDLSEAGREVVVDMRNALRELNSALAKLDSSVLGEENLTLFNETLAEFNAAIRNLNTEVLGTENTENLRAALANFRETSENLARASDTVAREAERLGPLLESAQATVDRAGDAVGAVADASRKAGAAIDRATDGGGLLAALINDRGLRDDFEALVSNLRNHGILRYRDSAGAAAAERPPPPSQRRGILRNR